jgi:serine/threonine protein kinase
MSYCINPACQTPQNLSTAQACQSCGAQLLLKDRYRILKLIAQGGFGRTFLAVDETQAAKPRCVVKQFCDRPQNNPDKAATLFRQEASRLAQLGSHPQIPNLLGYIEQPDQRPHQQFVIQEFIDGLNLEQELAQQGAWPSAKVHKLLASMLPVLDFIHSHQVIHRDIKPENIISRSSGPFVLVDFGAAKSVTGTTLAKTGTIIGSASYAAPEQAAGKATFASDIYSLGVTCLRLITHMSPFDLFDLGEGTWAWKNYLTQSLDPNLAAILDKMIVSATNRRYTNAAEVLQDLKHGVSTAQTNTQPFVPQARQPTIPQVRPASKAAPAGKFDSPRSSPLSSPIPIEPLSDNRANHQFSVKWSCLKTLEGHFKSVQDVAFSPYGQLIASASEDSTVNVWHAESGKLVRSLGKNITGSLDTVAFSSDGQLIAAAGYDGEIRLWQTVSGSCVGTLKGHSQFVSSLQFSPDGQQLLSTSYDNTLRLWSIIFNQRLFVWQVVNAKTIHVLTNIHSGWVCEATFSPNGQLVASVGDDGTVQLWDSQQGTLLKTLQGHEGMTQAIAFSRNGKLLVSCGKDQTLRVWDVNTGTGLRVLSGLSEATAVLFGLNDRFWVSAHVDCNIHIWQPTNHRRIGRLTGHSDLVNAIALSPNGQFLVSGSADKTIKIWQLRVT